MPDDFNTINQGLFFPSGTVPPSINAPSPNAQQCFFFSPIPDQCIEDQEDIIVQLTSIDLDVPFTVGGSQAGIYINDDDSTWLACLAIFEGKRGSGCETQVGGKLKLHGGRGTL